MNVNSSNDTEHPEFWLLCTCCGLQIPEMRVFLNNNTPLIDIKCSCTRIKEQSPINERENDLFENNLRYTYQNRVETVKLEDYLTYIKQLQPKTQNDNIKYCLNGHGKLEGLELKVHEKMLFETKHLISNYHIELLSFCQLNINKHPMISGKIFSEITEQVLCKKCAKKLDKKSKKRIIDLKKLKREVNDTIIQGIKRIIKEKDVNDNDNNNKLFSHFAELLIKSYLYVSKYQIPNYALAKSVLCFYEHINNSYLSSPNTCLINPLIQSIQYIKTLSINTSRYDKTNNESMLIQINKNYPSNNTDSNNVNDIGVKISNDFLYLCQGNILTFGKVHFDSNHKKHCVVLTKQYLGQENLSALIHLTKNIFCGIYIATEDSNLPQSNNNFMIYLLKLNTTDMKSKPVILFPNKKDGNYSKRLELSDKIYAYCKLNKKTIAIAGNSFKLYTISDEFDNITNVTFLYKGESSQIATNIIHWKVKANSKAIRDYYINNLTGNYDIENVHRDYNDYIAVLFNIGKLIIFSNENGKEFSLEKAYSLSNFFMTLSTNIENANESPFDMKNGKDNEKENNFVTCLTLINEKRKSIAMGTFYGNVFVFKDIMENGKLLVGHSKEVTCLVTLLNKQEFLSCGKDNKIIMWNELTCSILNIFWNYSFEIGNDENYITNICLFPSSYLGNFGFLTGDKNGTISYWANQGDIEAER